MARQQTRNYVTDLPQISSKGIKKLIDSNVSHQFTSRAEIKLTVQVKDNHAWYLLASGRVIQGELDKTVLSYGWRYWFICPCCNQRRASLFFTSKSIACRKCFNLHYESQSEEPSERLRRKIRELRSKIHDNPYEYCNLFTHTYNLPKRKGMSQKKFIREQAKLLKIESIYWRSMVGYVNNLTCKIK